MLEEKQKRGEWQQWDQENLLKMTE